jgi:hypothetical protein
MNTQPVLSSAILPLHKELQEDPCGMHVIEVLKQPKWYLSLLGLTILILLYLDKVCDIYCKFILCMTAVYDDHCGGCCLVVYLTDLQVSVFCE